MRISLINDWQYLFNPHAIGGRFAAFTFFNICYMNPKVFEGTDFDGGGVHITVMGLGITISRKEKQ